MKAITVVIGLILSILVLFPILHQTHTVKATKVLPTLTITDTPTPIPQPISSNGKLRLMAMGDSITAYYQEYLFEKIGTQVQFVGSMNDMPSKLDRHEGHYGWEIQNFTDGHAIEYLNLYHPDIILLMIGTNDIARNIENSSVGERLDQLISIIESTLPNSQLFLASIPPMNLTSDGDYDGGNQRTDAYNKQVQATVSYHKELGENIHYVDIYDSITRDELLDHVHPNSQANTQIANVWYQALLPYINN